MSAIEDLAAVIADAAAVKRVTGTATVVSVNTVSTPMRVEVSDGTDGTTTRSAIWADSGPIPQAGDKVLLVQDGAAVPVVLGRVPAPGQSANFGTRPVSAGSVSAGSMSATGSVSAGSVSASGPMSASSVSDGSGNLRTGINTAQTAAGNAHGRADDAWSYADTANGAAGNAHGRADDAYSLAGNAQSTANSAQSTANNAASNIATLQGQVASLQTDLANLTNAHNTLLNHYANHTSHAPGYP